MSRLPKLSRPVVLGVVLALAILIGVGAFAARQAANAAEPLAGNRVTAADVRILVRAASSCSALTPARLAGQVMATSNFGSRPVPEMRDGGRTGIAALTPEQWRKYAPRPDADPSDREAGITALAHATCQFVGQARAVKIAQDPWRVALAAYRLGMDRAAPRTMWTPRSGTPPGTPCSPPSAAARRPRPPPPRPPAAARWYRCPIST
jgi:hypothetical protein